MLKLPQMSLIAKTSFKRIYLTLVIVKKNTKFLCLNRLEGRPPSKRSAQCYKYNNSENKIKHTCVHFSIVTIAVRTNTAFAVSDN